MEPYNIKLKKMPRSCWNNPKANKLKGNSKVWNDPSKNLLRDKDKDGIPDVFDPMPNKKGKWKDKI